MRKFNRTLNSLSLLSGIGSFCVALLALLISVDDNRPHINVPPPQHHAPPVADEPITRERNERREQFKAQCDWRIYEPQRQKWRDAHQHVPLGQYRTPAWLGTDPLFDYFYDFARDEIYCYPRAQPGEPVVYGGHTGNQAAERRRGIIFCIIVMAVCGTMLHLIQVIRARR